MAFSDKVFIVKIRNINKATMKLASKVVELDTVTQLIRKSVSRQRLPLNQFETSGLRFSNVQPNIKAIGQFKKMFGCNELPVSYMFILAFRYIGQLLVSSNIPSKLMGMIHLSSRFSVIQPHDWSQPADIDVRIISYQQSEKGISYLVSTHFYQMGQATLVNENQFLDKDSSYRGNKANAKWDIDDSGILNVTVVVQQKFTSHLARQYAKVSSDYNPIHIHPWLAKLFGMKSSVMHGMYGIHWLLTQKLQNNVEFKKELHVQFNRPCYLPNEVLLVKYNGENSYALFSKGLEDRFLKVTFKSLNETIPNQIS